MTELALRHTKLISIELSSPDEKDYFTLDIQPTLADRVMWAILIAQYKEFTVRLSAAACNLKLFDGETYETDTKQILSLYIESDTITIWSETLGVALLTMETQQYIDFMNEHCDEWTESEGTQREETLTIDLAVDGDVFATREAVFHDEVSFTYLGDDRTPPFSCPVTFSTHPVFHLVRTLHFS